MHPFLAMNNFVEPNYLRNINGVVEIGNMQLSCHGDKYVLSDSENGVWMTYRFDTQEEALELYSHYRFAKGHCICTGLGLGVREQWLLNNPKVTKITVVERNQNVIDFHKKYNPELMERISVYNSPATHFVLCCDTLLADHYSKENIYDMMNDLDKVVKNMPCETMWFWPLEEYLLETSHCRDYHRAYRKLREERYPKLPDITAHELYDLLSTWYPTYATREIEGR